MGQIELAQQSLEVRSRTEGLFNYAPEGDTPGQIFRNALYGIADAFLNIREVDGSACVDLSPQPNKLERRKSQAGLFVLETWDWLRQVAKNIAEANKPALFAQSVIGLPSVMGAVNLLTTDFYENPLHALVVDMPEQQGSFPCDAVQVAAQNLCTAGVVGGVIVECLVDSLNPGRVQINLMNSDGGVLVTTFSDDGVPETNLAITCDTIGNLALQPDLSQTTTVPATAPAELQPIDCSGENVTDLEGNTSEVLSLKTGRSESNPNGDINILKESIEAVCGINVSDTTAEQFLRETQSPWPTDVYNIDASGFESWLAQYQSVPDAENIVGNTPIPPVVETEVSSEAAENSCLQPVRIEIPLNLDNQAGLHFFIEEVYRLCNIALSPQQAEAIMASRNPNLPENVHAVSIDYLQEFLNSQEDLEDYTPGERYSAWGRYLAIIAGLSTIGTLSCMAFKRVKFSDIFGTDGR